MATRKTILEVELVSDAAKVVDSFDDAGNAASKMGDKIDAASRTADDASSRVDRAADASDNLASKSSQATGGLGALASGMALVGADKYAAGLESAAMATDFFSGVGDISNLVLQSSIALKIKDAVATVRKTVAEKASAAATKAMTVAQWALNAALNANPLALIAIAIAGVIALLVILYKRNEGVRKVIDKLRDVALAAFRKIADGVSKVVDWFKDKLPAAGRVAKTLIVGYFKLMTLPLRTLINVIQNVIGWAKDKLPGAFSAARDKVANIVESVRTKVGTIIDKARAVADWVRQNLASAFTTAKDKIKAPIDTVTGWIDNLVNIVEDLVGWIGDIKFPKPPSWLTDGIDLTPWNKSGGKAGGTATGRDGVFVDLDITVQGAVDPVATAEQLRQILSRQSFWNGQLVTVS